MPNGVVSATANHGAAAAVALGGQYESQGAVVGSFAFLNDVASAAADTRGDRKAAVQRSGMM